MKFSIHCKYGKVVVADDTFVAQSTYARDIVDDLGGDRLEVEENASIARTAVAWCNNGSLTVPHLTKSIDHVLRLAHFADFTGMDVPNANCGSRSLLDDCAYLMNQIFLAHPKMLVATSTTVPKLRGMSNIVQSKVLDHADSVTFPSLRIFISPSGRHYYEQLSRLLSRSNFACTHSFSTARDTYMAVIKAQKSVSEQMAAGCLHRETRFMALKAAYSPDSHHLCTAENTFATVTLLDLHVSPFRVLWAQDDVLDAVFGPETVWVTSHLSGKINIWSITERISHHITFVMDRTHRLFSSDHYLGATRNNELKIWKWASLMSLSDCRLFGPTSRASFSPNGQFAIVSAGRGVQFLAMPDGQLQDPVVMERNMQEPVSHLLIFGDSTLIAAVSWRYLEIWSTDNVGSAATELHVRGILPATEGRREKIRHAVFSPDSSQLLVGCSTGDLIMFARSSNSFQELFRLQQDGEINHIAWSPDGRFITLSSYDGMAIIDIAERLRDHGLGGTKH